MKQQVSTALLCLSLATVMAGRVLAQFGPGPTKAPPRVRWVPAETAAAKGKEPNGKAPRTGGGHPDLSGIWTSDDMRGIPTTRPASQKERESLTPEEFARRAGGEPGRPARRL